MREQQDQVVRARAHDDVLGVEADVPARRLPEVAVRAVGVLVEARHARAERHLRHARERRRVLVELEDGLARDAVPLRDLVDRGRPPVRRVAVGDRVGPGARDAHAGTAAACSGSPSTRASGPTTAAARPAAPSSAVTTCSGLRNASIPSPPVERASPPVGRTCVAPAA